MALFLKGSLTFHSKHDDSEPSLASSVVREIIKCLLRVMCLPCSAPWIEILHQPLLVDNQDEQFLRSSEVEFVLMYCLDEKRLIL